MSSEVDVVLHVGDVGSFDELSRKANPKALVLQYMPGLAALLARAADLKGDALSDSEVARIAAVATVVAVPSAVAEAVSKERGYD